VISWRIDEIYDLIINLSEKLNLSTKDIFYALNEYGGLKSNEYGSLSNEEYQELEKRINNT